MTVLIRTHGVGDFANAEYTVDTADNTSVAALLLECHLSAQHYSLIAVNDVFVAGCTVPQDGDTIDVFLDLSGG